jgi:hypothetical protein
MALLSCVLLMAVSCQPKTAKMETRVSVKGLLRDNAGQPVKDAIVMIAEGSHSHQDIASVTNDSGEFYLPNIVVPGKYTLQIRTGSGTVQKQVNLSNDSTIELTY